MQLRLKIVYLFLWYFLELKIDKNWVLWKQWFYFCLRFRRHVFRQSKFYFFLNFDLKCVIEKCVSCFLVYLFLGGGGGFD